ncbi:MAG: hypothetical protein WC243_03890 [Patescibacteria group bacterium]|jgi:hypothetical protein
MTLLTRLSLNKLIICKSTCFASVLAFIVSIVLQVYFSNSSAIKSNEMIALNEKRVLLEEEISVLGHEITAISCLSNIEQLAREKGFVDMESALLVVKPAAVAMAR